MAKTKIEWADYVWNPVTGCSKVSEGCRHCYGESLARRFRKDFKPWTAQNAEHNVRLHPERLAQPFHLIKPRRIFTNSVSDLFHEQVPDVFISAIFASMTLAPQHIYQILTKRAKRMNEYFLSRERWPVEKLWLGISAEDQPTFDERARYLLQTPAAKRFVSLEPLLGPVDVSSYLTCIYCRGKGDSRCDDSDSCSGSRLDWVIVGGESGAGARPMHPDWVRSIRDQCQAAGVPFWFKQWGQYTEDPCVKSNISATEAFSDTLLYRVGKKAAGNMLDGRVWEEYPS